MESYIISIHKYTHVHMYNVYTVETRIMALPYYSNHIFIVAVYSGNQHRYNGCNYIVVYSQ